MQSVDWLKNNSLCTDVRPPSEKSREKSLLPIFSEGGGTSVHRLKNKEYGILATSNLWYYKLGQCL